MPSGDRQGQLADLSESGACVELSNPPPVGALAMLKWGPHESFCTVVWAKASACGVTFEKPISQSVVFETISENVEAIALAADPTRIPLGQKRSKR
jgi:hypothetical protein